MIYFTDTELEQLVSTEALSGDWTMNLLDMAGRHGEVSITVRDDTTICGTEEAVAVFRKMGLDVKHCAPSGYFCKKGDQVLGAEGDLAAIYTGCRAVSTMMAYASGIAERTRRLVVAAQQEVPEIMAVGAANQPPLLKKFLQKALQAGGAESQCTGLSNAILILQEHLTFFDGYETLHKIVDTLRHKQKNRMIVVEVGNAIDALVAARSGAHFIQIFGMPPLLFAATVNECKKVSSKIGIIASGDICDTTAPQYAIAGADILMSTWMYTAPPATIAVHIAPADDQVVHSAIDVSTANNVLYTGGLKQAVVQMQDVFTSRRQTLDGLANERFNRLALKEQL